MFRGNLFFDLSQDFFGNQMAMASFPIAFVDPTDGEFESREKSPERLVVRDFSFRSGDIGWDVEPHYVASLLVTDPRPKGRGFRALR